VEIFIIYKNHIIRTLSQTNWEADKMRVLFAFSSAYCSVFSLVVSSYLGFVFRFLFSCQ
jgi:hypothetical protein